VPGRRDGKSTAGAFTVSPHAVTRDVDFAAIADATVATDPPAGWTPVVRRGGDVWVAVRETPARQVWVGFDAPRWPREPGYVVFWAGVLDWLGGGGDVTYTASTVAESGPDWAPPAGAGEGIGANHWPGLFRRADGALKAVNSGLITPGAVSDTGWKTQIPTLRTGALTPLAPWVALAALVCLALAAALWKRPSLTEISGKTTVAVDGVSTEARAARAD
jgi:hypothetical protein